DAVPGVGGVVDEMRHGESLRPGDLEQFLSLVMQVGDRPVDRRALRDAALCGERDNFGPGQSVATTEFGDNPQAFRLILSAARRRPIPYPSGRGRGALRSTAAPRGRRA